MHKRSLYLFAVCAVAAAIAPSSAHAIVVTPFDSTYDSWIWELNPGQALGADDGMWVTKSSNYDSSKHRTGLVQFNLSGVTVPITAAWLELAPRGNGAGSPAGVQLAPAGWVNSSAVGGPVVGLSYADYQLTIEPPLLNFESLGSGDFKNATVANGAYGLTASASAADLSVLNTIRTGDGIITLVITAASGGREFNDNSTYGSFLPVKLVINQAAPIVGDLNGDFLINTADYTIFKTNWRQTVPGNTGGDLNGDGTVTLADFVQFKSLYDAFPGNSGAAMSPVPEPSTLLLLVTAAFPAALWFRRRLISKN